MNNSNVLKNRYEILEELTQTSIFYVYLAKDNIYESFVSIYRMKEEFFHDKPFLDGYREGIIESKDLDHPNTLKLIDIDVDDDMALFIYEYAKGKTLRDILDNQKIFTIEKGSEIIISVLKSLDNAHIMRLSHGDLNSEDVIVTVNGTVKVRGYGRKDAINASPHAKEILDHKNISYQSPEVIENKLPNEASDIYSAGIIYYEMLTGKLPYSGNTTIEIASKILRAEPDNPRFVNKDIPASINNLILNSISNDVAGRIETASIYIADISDIIRNKNKRPVDNFSSAGSVGSKVTLKKKNDFEHKKITIPVLILFFILAAGMTTLLTIAFSGKGKVAVPSVIGEAGDSAVSKLEELGFTVKIGDELFSEEYASGNVVFQKPSAGSKIKKGEVVLIQLSKGNEYVKMPEITGMSREQAAESISNAGLILGDISMEYSETVPIDYVISSSPAAGMSINNGGTVDLVLSKGPDFNSSLDFGNETEKQDNENKSDGNIDKKSRDNTDNTDNTKTEENSNNDDSSSSDDVVIDMGE